MLIFQVFSQVIELLDNINTDLGDAEIKSIQFILKLKLLLNGNGLIQSAGFILSASWIFQISRQSIQSLIRNLSVRWQEGTEQQICVTSTAENIRASSAVMESRRLIPADRTDYLCPMLLNLKINMRASLEISTLQMLLSTMLKYK